MRASASSSRGGDVSPRRGEMKDRFQGYRRSPSRRRKGVAQKIAFRLVRPRNRLLAPRLPPLRGEAATDNVLVLAYHAVSEDWEATLSVRTQRFEAQIARLAERGYRGVTFAEAVRGEYEGKAVAITFDDGYRSVLEVAKPILDAHGMPATAFLVTDHVGSERPMTWDGIDCWLDGPHADELIPMSWAEARQLVDDGWEIGSHTRTHPKLTEVDDARLREELEGSRAECERQLGRPCETIAYPYGDLDLRVEEAAMRAGYAGAAALAPRPGRPPAFCWPRTGVYQIDNRRSFEIKTSRTVRRLQRTRSWSMIGGIAHALRRHEPGVE